MKNRILLLAAALVMFASPAGAVKLSDYPTMSALAGTELLTGVQSGANKNATPELISTYVAANLNTLTFLNAGLKILDTNASHTLTISPGSDLTANRVFTLTTGDAARVLNISAADVTVSGYGATLVDDADAATARATLGTGTIATQAASAVAITGGTIDATTIGATTPTTGVFTTATVNALNIPNTATTPATAGLASPTATTMGFYVGGTRRGLIVGSTNLLWGTGGSDQFAASNSETPSVQVHNTGTGAGFGAARASNDTVGAYLHLGKNRNAAISANTIVTSGDELGRIVFDGNNGTTYTPGAQISAYSDGTPGASNDMPGRLEFYTTPDGSGTLTKRMTLDNKGHWITAGTAPALATGSGDCGTTPAIAGNDTAGQITVGSSTNGGKCTITFAQTWTNAPICMVANETATAAIRPVTTTSTLALTGTLVAANVLKYYCVGR